MLGPSTNGQMRVLMFISIALSLVTLITLFWGAKTIQLESDSTGKIYTGTMRQHPPKLPKATESIDNG